MDEYTKKQIESVLKENLDFYSIAIRGDKLNTKWLLISADKLRELIKKD